MWWRQVRHCIVVMIISSIFVILEGGGDNLDMDMEMDIVDVNKGMDCTL